MPFIKYSDGQISQVVESEQLDEKNKQKMNKFVKKAHQILDEEFIQPLVKQGENQGAK